VKALQAALVFSIYLPLVFGRDGAVFAIDGHGQRVTVERDYAIVKCANGVTPLVTIEQNIVIVRCKKC
jgi:hypothetical protein